MHLQPTNTEPLPLAGCLAADLRREISVLLQAADSCPACRIWDLSHVLSQGSGSAGLTTMLHWNLVLSKSDTAIPHLLMSH